MKNCNTLAGIKVFGLQTEESRFNCQNNELMNSQFDSINVERMIVTTQGSFIAKSLSEWSKQVISLVQAETFSPRVIRRELRPILHLFESKNFENVVVINETINVTYIREWMQPFMERYCEIFQLECNKSGCGIDDNCTIEQWCVDQASGYYQCIQKSEIEVLRFIAYSNSSLVQI